VQNIVCFDYKPTVESDLLQLFQVCVLPFSSQVTLYRLFVADSYEQRVYQHRKNYHSLQKIMFDDSVNHWEAFPRNLDECTLRYPLNLTTEAQVGKQRIYDMLPLNELSRLLRIAAEPIALAP